MPRRLARAVALWLAVAIVSGADSARGAARATPAGCPEVREGSVATPLAIALTPLAAARDALDLVSRWPYPIFTAIDPGHPRNYLFAPVVWLGSAHSYLFFSGTGIQPGQDGLEVLFDPMQCGLELFPSLRALW